ncbi:hypothetical protein [Brachybacterium alimentarium]|uniref:hypothetical protein n=1 Tax=Brachybacterium alimentarium TaxID=47845 RepID=UPI003FB8F7D0
MSATLGRPSTAPRDRALRLELTLQRPLLWGSGVVAALLLLAAIGQFARLGNVLILLAVAVPVAAAPRDPAREGWLSGTLGISRAARVRARVRVVLFTQLGLLLAAAVVILVGPQGGGGDPATLGRVSAGGLSLPVPTLAYWQDVVIWASAAVWSHIWVGRDALHDASTAMWARALASYLGMYVVVTAVTFGVRMLPLALGALLGREPVAGPAQEYPAVLAGAAVFGAGLLVLRWRSRAWAQAA